MLIKYSRDFVKSYKTRIKSYPKLHARFKERIKLFVRDSSNPLLRDHKLVGRQTSFRAFSITGDIRVIYFPENEDTATFIDVGSHNQVYGK